MQSIWITIAFELKDFFFASFYESGFTVLPIFLLSMTINK